jgi:hypothetical protein
MPRANLGGTYMVPEIPDFDWESLERASGLPFIEHQRAAFVAAMHRYLRYLKEQRKAVQIKDLRRHWQEILKHASALVDLFDLRTKNTPRIGDRTPSDEDYITFHQNVFAQFIGVCSRLKWSKHVTKPPLRAWLATDGSKAAHKISSACSNAFR